MRSFEALHHTIINLDLELYEATAHQHSDEPIPTAGSILLVERSSLGFRSDPRPTTRPTHGVPGSSSQAVTDLSAIQERKT